MSQIIGNNSDYNYYNNLKIQSQQAIYKNYWNSKQGAFIDTIGNVPFSTAQALALDFDVLGNNTEEINACINSLVHDMTVTNNGHLVQSIIGVKYILRILCRYNYCNVALNSTLQKNYPSYDYWIINKATTLWENWQSTEYHASGSKNHIMFGGQSVWYYQYLAGIRNRHNTYNWKYIDIDPYTNATIYDINFIDATIDTLNGLISVSWQVYSTNGYLCGTGNENTNVILECNGNKIKSIPFASYGTPTGSCGNYQIDNKCNSNNSTSTINQIQPQIQ